jgi:hypothetical protein
VITVDGRAGSGFGDTNNLIPYLTSCGIHVEKGTLKYGDVEFLGNGPEGRVVPFGIEVKSIADFLDSMTNGRLVGTQLPGLQRSYEFPMIFIHGKVRAAPDGVLEVMTDRWGWIKPKKTIMLRDMYKFLYTMKYVHRIDYQVFPEMLALANEIVYLYGWWTSKEWDEHESGHAFDFSTEKVYLHQPSFTRSVAKELPGIGWKKSLTVVRSFKTMYQMALAEKADWASVPGIGKVLAHRIYCAIRGVREGRG